MDITTIPLALLFIFWGYLTNLVVIGRWHTFMKTDRKQFDATMNWAGTIYYKFAAIMVFVPWGALLVEWGLALSRLAVDFIYLTTFESLTVLVSKKVRQRETWKTVSGLVAWFWSGDKNYQIGTTPTVVKEHLRPDILPVPTKTYLKTDIPTKMDQPMIDFLNAMPKPDGRTGDDMESTAARQVIDNIVDEVPLGESGFIQVDGATFYVKSDGTRHELESCWPTSSEDSHHQ